LAAIARWTTWKSVPPIAECADATKPRPMTRPTADAHGFSAGAPRCARNPSRRPRRIGGDGDGASLLLRAVQPPTSASPKTTAEQIPGRACKTGAPRCKWPRSTRPEEKYKQHDERAEPRQTCSSNHQGFSSMGKSAAGTPEQKSSWWRGEAN